MKKPLIALFLALSVSVGMAYSQDNPAADSEDTAQALEAPAVKSTENEEDGIHFSLNLDTDDDELSTDQKFEIMRKAIKEVSGSEFDKELEVKVETMTDEEKERLVNALEQGFKIDVGDSDLPPGVMFIAALAILLVLGMPVFIVLIVLWFGHRKRRQRLELIQGFLDAGKDVPHEVLTAYDVDGSNSLRKGIMLTAIGLGIVSAFNAMGDSDIGALGLIPLFIGIARLIYWYLVERKSA